MYVTFVLIDHVVAFVFVVFLFIDNLLASRVALFLLLAILFFGRCGVLSTSDLLDRVLDQVYLAVVYGSIILVLEDDTREEFIIDSTFVYINNYYVIWVPIQKEVT